jgi:hypothetical protein
LEHYLIIKTILRMKKIIFSLLLAGLLTFGVNELTAQSYGKGDLVINAGLQTNAGTNLIGTIDLGVADNISVGAGLWFQSILGSSGASLLARGAYHFGDAVNVDKLDLYGGGELAINLNGGGTNFALLPGARYYFSDKIGGFAELPIYIGSFGGTYLRLGVAFKL